MSDRASRIARFVATRGATESIAAWLSPEDQLLQSMPDCSPTKWHRAHTSWFFEEFLLGPQGVAPHDAAYRYLFNSYYEAVGPRHPRPQRGLLSRPTCDEVSAWRREVDGRVVALLESCDEAALASLGPVLDLGIAHEEQHQELMLTDILHAFSQHPLRPRVRPEAPALAPADAPPMRWIDHPGGLFEVGHDGEGFAFDNEGPRHRVFLEPFSLASRPVTAGELRAFIEEGGYREPRWWLSEGWAWVQAHARVAPHNAALRDGRLVVFGVDGEREARDDEPAAHLTLYEADALARFLGGRLPTEFEWEVIAAQADPSQANDREAGALRPMPGAGDGVTQMFGDVWEWTASAYSPYPGFRPGDGAIGEYNGKFMVSQQVLRGGSCFTPRGHARGSYRNFWHPHTLFQMTGARVARDTR
ncbi:MAG: ergothioneine biosynthesis protein EgtB [Polyangiales bacterium]